jgi:hypothetical protein
MLTLPALPAAADTTSTTVSLTGGAQRISVPAAKDLGSAATGTSSLSAQLGSMAVADARGALLGTWTATVSSTDLTTGGRTANATIANAAVTSVSDPVTAQSGTAVRVPGQATSANAQTLSSARTAFSATGVVGNNNTTTTTTTTWDPILTVTIPSAAVSGTYSGTVTHWVA